MIADVGKLRRHVGHPDQAYGTRLVRIADGGGDGIRAVEVWNAAGLRLDVLVDRGFDIHRAEHRGRALMWNGPQGLRSRFAYERPGWGWLRNFHGGLVMTCGLEHVLLPLDRPTPEYQLPVEEPQHFGLHGRVANEGADLLAREVDEDGEQPVIRLRGQVVQAAIFGENLWLDRTIEVPLFEPVIRLYDVVANRGWSPTHHELLYHVNLGWPLVDKGTAVDVGDGSEPVVATEPQEGFEEVVTEHRPPADADGRVRVTARRPDGLGLELTYGSGPLPWFYVWYMMGAGTYAIGLEPCSIRRERDPSAPLSYLQPGESVRYEAAFRVLEGM